MKVDRRIVLRMKRGEMGMGRCLRTIQLHMEDVGKRAR